MKRETRILIMAGAALLIATAAWLATRTNAALHVATGLVSQTLCAGVFVSHVDPDALYADTILTNPGEARLANRLHYDIDRNRREVNATYAGHFRSRAVFRDDLGCVIVHDSEPPAAPTTSAVHGSNTLPAPVAPLPVAAPSPQIEAALDRTFAEPDPASPRHVRAALILYNGQIIGERYAPGYSAQTLLKGYSVAKSVTSVLIGILVREGSCR